MLAALVLSMMMGFDPSVLTVPIVHAEELTKEWTVEEMKTLATEKAKAHGLNVFRFLETIRCESLWDRFAVGDQGRSHGLAQFYYPGRWGISTTSAYEPEIALEVMAQAWEDDRYSEWSCWWVLGYNK